MRRPLFRFGMTMTVIGLIAVVAGCMWYCIAEYARLTHDAIACELLPPSDYGMRCIANVWSEIITEDQCSSDGQALHCKHGTPYQNRPTELYWTVEEFPVPDLQACHKITSPAVRDWCFSERVTRGISDDCSAVTPHSQRHDDCLQFLALRNKDPALCNPIEHDDLRTLCIVHVRARK
jgi:hypothetical protein